MSFANDVRLWTEKTKQSVRQVVAESAQEAHRSITAGSELTGAPGQPIDTGKLYDSWKVKQLSEVQYLISTRLFYASIIEEGVRRGYKTKRGRTVPAQRLTFRIGGPHSVALTRAGWPRIVDVVAARVAAGASLYS